MGALQQQQQQQRQSLACAATSLMADCSKRGCSRGLPNRLQATDRLHLHSHMHSGGQQAHQWHLPLHMSPPAHPLTPSFVQMS
jgi:hypothetical protein